MLYNYWAVMAFLFGAIVGSFLNVVVWRLPRGQSLTHPGSHCPKCDRPLAAFENIPLVSFLALRARCRTCKAPISWRYFWVELITASTFLAVYLKFGPGIQTVAYCLFLAPLIAAFCTDVDAFLIPDQLHLFALFVGIAFDVHGIVTGAPGHQLLWGWLPTSIWGGFLCAGVFLLIQVVGLVVFRKEAMGDGDVKLARAIGAMLPLKLALVSFFIAIAVGAVWGVANLLRQAAAGGGDETAESNESEESPEPEGEKESPFAPFAWAGIYLLYVDALLFIARALRIPRVSAVADNIVPLGVEEDDDFHPGATHLPFGPFMVVGAVIAIFFGEALLRWYLSWSGLG